MRLLSRAACLGAAALTLALPARAANGPDVIHVGKSTLTLSWRGSEADIGRAGLIAWIERSAGIVNGYFGQFPIDAVELRVSVAPGARVMHGRTFGAPNAFMELTVGQHVTAQALYEDWILVHEMTHLALPEVLDPQDWLAEGVATYVEGIARVQGGNMSAASLWSEYAADMPKGLPGRDDQGLDRTHTWARTYWGGALFFLVADVRIREQSANKRGLQNALRAIDRAGGGMENRWPAERIFSTGDAATGTHVLMDLYAAMKDKPYAPDLPALWADLGVVPEDGGVRLDDNARLAAVRRAITTAMPYCNVRSVSTTATRQASSALSIDSASESCTPSPSQ